MRRIGLLIGARDENDPVAKTIVSAFTQALADLGWTDGRNVRIDLRWAGGDINRIRASAQELVGLQSDIIVASATPVTAAVQRETRTIPIVFAGVSEPVASGLVARLDRPNGNITTSLSTNPRWGASGLSCSPRSRPGSSGPQSCSILTWSAHRPEGVPSVLVGLWALAHLTDKPIEAAWLEPVERVALQARIDHERKSREAMRHYKLGEALTSPRVLGLSLVYFGLLCGLYGLTYWLPQIVKDMATNVGLDKVTGVSINALAGYLVVVPYAFATVAMFWWARHSDVTRERVWHVVLPAVVSGLSLIASAYLGNPVLAAVALIICAMEYMRPCPPSGPSQPAFSLVPRPLAASL